MSIDLSPRPDTAAAPLDVDELSALTRSLAAQPDLWQPLVRFQESGRWWTRLDAPPGVDVWLLTWLPSQGTELHDHGGSAAAFTIVAGTLTEVRPTRTATSCRGASPPTRPRPSTRVTARRAQHRDRAGGEHPRVLPAADPDDVLGPARGRVPLPGTDRGHRRAGVELVTRTIDDVLAEARAGLHRLDPSHAWDARRRARCWSTSGRPPSGPPRARCRRRS